MKCPIKKTVAMMIVLFLGCVFYSEANNRGIRQISLDLEVESNIVFSRANFLAECALTPISTTTDLYSGAYCLADDINGVVTIVDDNVLLCLNSYRIYGGATGVIVNSGVKNVIIKGGNIGPTSGNGILVNTGCSNVGMYDLDINNCLVGISLLSTVTSINIVNCDVAGCTTGLKVSSCSGLLLQNSSFHYNTVDGILLEDSDSATIIQCDMSANTTGITLSSSSGIVVESCNACTNSQAGFSLINSSDNYFRSCNAIRTTGNADTYGFVSVAGRGNIFVECNAKNSTTSSALAAERVAGFMFNIDEYESMLANCKCDGTTVGLGGLAYAYGVLLDLKFDALAFLTNASPAHSDNVRSVDWSPDGSYLVTGGDTSGGQETRVYSFDEQGSPILGWAADATFAHGADVYSVDWSSNGTFIAIGGDSASDSQEARVYTFDVDVTPTLLWLANVGSYDNRVYSVQWSPDGAYLAIGTAYSVGEPTVQVYEFDLEATPTLNLGADAVFDHGATVRSVDWSPEGDYLAIAGDTAGDGHEVRMYKFDVTATTTLNWVANAIFAHGATVHSVDWSPDGNYLAIGGATSAGHEVRVYQFDITATPTLRWVADLAVAHGSTVYSVQWSSDGYYLGIGGATSGGQEIRVYQFDVTVTPTLQVVANANPPHGATVYSISWSPGEWYLAMGGVPSGGEDIRVYTALDSTHYCIVKDCLINGTTGGSGAVGVKGSDAGNLIINNLAYLNTTNYDPHITRVHSGYSGTPGYFDNISLP